LVSTLAAVAEPNEPRIRPKRLFAEIAFPRDVLRFGFSVRSDQLEMRLFFFHFQPPCSLPPQKPYCGPTPRASGALVKASKVPGVRPGKTRARRFVIRLPRRASLYCRKWPQGLRG